jgi:hypothetical protein
VRRHHCNLAEPAGRVHPGYCEPSVFGGSYVGLLKGVFEPGAGEANLGTRTVRENSAMSLSRLRRCGGSETVSQSSAVRPLQRSLLLPRFRGPVRCRHARRPNWALARGACFAITRA